MQLSSSAKLLIFLPCADLNRGKIKFSASVYLFLFLDYSHAYGIKLLNFNSHDSGTIKFGTR